MDHAQGKYEKLRTTFCDGGNYEGYEFWEDFALLGMYALFQDAYDNKKYVVEVYQISPLRWCGKTDPRFTLLREVFLQLLGSEHEAPYCLFAGRHYAEKELTNSLYYQLTEV